ncbi:MAG: biotin/lipoyl-containing protein, partial [Pseudomonadota bacterium]
LIARDLDALTVPAAVRPLEWLAAGQAVLGLTTPKQHAGFALWQPLRWSVRLSLGDETEELSVELLSSTRQRWLVAGETIEIAVEKGVWRWRGTRLPRTHVEQGTVTVFSAYGLTFTFEDPLAQGADAEGDADVILSPMPGLVTDVFVAAGQKVTKGARLAVLEAMKMEHALVAPRDGSVAAVLVETGAQVDAGAALVQLAAKEAE